MSFLKPTLSGNIQPLAAGRRSGLAFEIIVVLLISLGQSAIYAIVSLIGTLTQGELKDATASLNNSQAAERPLLDLTYQLLDFLFPLALVALVVYLLAQVASPFRVSKGTEREPSVALAGAVSGIGLDFPGGRRWPDIRNGIVLAAVIGVPGLAFYFIGRAWGITANVSASGLDSYWWTIPVLILLALKNALLEEVIAVAYLSTRLAQLGWGFWSFAVTSSVLRGSYHLYQGFGPFVGNVAMGLVFCWAYRKTGRVLPLVIAHWVLDIVAFVGYQYAGHLVGLK